jgi:hypothetical protein
MTTTTAQIKDFFADTQKQALLALEGAQDWSLRAAELAIGLLPPPPQTYLPKGLPTAAELVEGGFGLASKVLDSQKAFALRIAEAVTPPAPARPAKS